MELELKIKGVELKVNILNKYFGQTGLGLEIPESKSSPNLLSPNKKQIRSFTILLDLLEKRIARNIQSKIISENLSKRINISIDVRVFIGIHLNDNNLFVVQGISNSWKRGGPNK